MRCVALLLLSSCVAGRAAAQGLASPEVHWGANMLPDLQDRADFSLHFLGFTRYGKEVFRQDTTRYTFLPYNDMPATLGFNILSYSRMENGVGFGNAGRAPDVDPGPLSRRRTYMVGIINDHIPEFLQNDVIHRGNFLHNKLRPVPRELTDTKTHTSYGPTYLEPLILGWSDEYFLRLYTTQHDDGRDTRRATPLFIGGGWQLSTLNQEAFIHAGSNVYEKELPEYLGPWWLRLRSVGVGGELRAGVLKAGHYFRDVTPVYANAQGLLRANAEVAGYGLQFEYALTSANGFFAAPRSAAELAEIQQFPVGTDSTTLYHDKTPVHELFFSIRVRLGEFSFETYNDSPGGKDKGPSFGAFISYNLYRPDRKFPWIGGGSKRQEGTQ